MLRPISFVVLFFVIQVDDTFRRVLARISKSIIFSCCSEWGRPASSYYQPSMNTMRAAIPCIRRSKISRSLIIVATMIVAFAAPSHSFLTRSTVSVRSSCNQQHKRTLFRKTPTSLLPTQTLNKSSMTKMTSLTMVPSMAVKTIASLHTNNNFVLSVLTILAACGIAMEKNTTIGKAISVSKMNSLFQQYHFHN